MSSEHRVVYVGSGAWEGETGVIQVFAFEPRTAELALLQELPAGGAAAYMDRSADGRILYVADETLGCLRSYEIAADGRLSQRSEVRCSGRPVYVALHRSGEYLLTCFFEEAKTEVFKLRDDGHLGTPTCLVDSGSESHCTVFDPSHRFVFVPTRAAGWIAQYQFDPSRGQLSHPVFLHEAAGAGPRHFTFHPNGRYAYLINELSLELSVFSWDSNGGSLGRIQQGLSTRLPGTQAGAAADIHVHPNGRYLYVSNRQGDDSNLAVFALEAQGSEARLLGHESTRGRTPRNFAVDEAGGWLLVGNRESANLSAFQLEEAGARLRHSRTIDVAPGPFYVGIYPLV